MADPADPPAPDRESPSAGDGPSEGGADGDRTDRETLRSAVEERYDFADFAPADMAAMSAEEWEAAFDEAAWITGPELLDRVSAELRSRVGRRELFAVVERTDGSDGGRVLAYDDVGYALVAPDGTVEGEGPILADVEPVVALCSMAEYDVAEPSADAGLPAPDEIAPASGGLGDRLLLVLAAVQVVAGLGLLVAPLVAGVGGGLLTTVAGLGFLAIGVLLGLLVANARLSGRFRAAEYRERLRAAGVGTDERPAFLPDEDGDGPGGSADRDGGDPERRGPD